MIKWLSIPVYLDRSKSAIDSSVVDGVDLPNETMWMTHAMIFIPWLIGQQMREGVRAAKVE